MATIKRKRIRRNYVARKRIVRPLTQDQTAARVKEATKEVFHPWLSMRVKKQMARTSSRKMEVVCEDMFKCSVLDSNPYIVKLKPALRRWITTHLLKLPKMRIPTKRPPQWWEPGYEKPACFL